MAFLDSSLSRYTPPTLEQAQRRQWWRRMGILLGVTAVAGYMAQAMILGEASPNHIAWVLFALTVAAILYRPRYGVYAIMLFTMMGDTRLVPWYPFDKNFSSAESILYFSDSFSFSPLEICIALTAVSWGLRLVLERDYQLKLGPIFWPTAAFTIMIAVALVYGLARGGNTTIALWESRPIFYILALMVLSANLLETSRHVSYAVWCVMLALFVEGIFGSWHTIVVLEFDLSQVQTIAEHSAAQHINTMILLIVASWLFADGSWSKRLLLPLLTPPVLLTYIATQRRSAFLTLGIALVLLAIFLYRERRQLFMFFAPIITIGGLIYLGIFWNNTGPLGLPAQAVKSVVAEDQANAADASSNEYRDIENINVGYTIRQEPLLGVGFGNKFYIVYPLPDISFFEWWEYITHNSIGWIWMKSGVFGFLSMIITICLGIISGVRTTAHAVSDDLKAISVTMTLYLCMHFIFAYVDMSWSNQSMVYVGFALGIISKINTDFSTAKG